jgi:asparagine synthase (glutamine-hydrolysing)
MPGLALYYSFGKIDSDLSKRISQASDLMKADDRYESDRLLQSDHIVVSFTAYPQYPRITIHNDEHFILVEGCVYNKDRREVAEELLQLSTEVFIERSDQADDKIARWLLASDGEYVVVLIQKSSGDLVLFNDALGSLPLFRYSKPDRILISREPKFIIETESVQALDRIGMAEYLIYGYNTGGRTMSEGITRFQPATLVRCFKKTRRTRSCLLHRWVVGGDFDGSMNCRRAASSLSDLFRSSVRNRIKRLEGLSPALALSGGLDSRSVLAAMVKDHAPFTAHTCLDHDRLNIADVRTAQTVAEATGCGCRRYELPKPSLPDVETVIRNQDGANSAIMAVAVQHYRQLVGELGWNVVMFTGDAGMQLKQPLKPSKKLCSDDDLLSATVGTLYHFPVDHAASLLRVKRSDLCDATLEMFNGYAEKQPEDKYAHFKLFSRPLRFTLVGEDRTRFYMWLAAPFWDLGIVRFVLRIPDRIKRNFKLYAAFLQELHPKAAAVPYSNIHMSILSPATSAYCALKRFIVSNPWIYQRVRPYHSRAGFCTYSDADVDLLLTKVLTSSRLLPEYFDMEILKRTLEMPMRRQSYFLLATIMLRTYLIEQRYSPDALRQYGTVRS